MAEIIQVRAHNEHVAARAAHKEKSIRWSFPLGWTRANCGRG